jgi:hypothetical protein
MTTKQVKKSRSFEAVVKKLGPQSAPPVRKSVPVHIGGIKPIARHVAPSRRFGGRRGPSA